ncbi:MAG: serine/threonine protein kinase [Oscillochloris sp.]|nr:serine/threonine protein kinase [Oscillochloris sp.]
MATPGTVGNGRYQITGRIGQGGMGAVYEAVDMRLGTQVALKQPTLNSQHAGLAFEREAKLLARLRHPALPIVSDYFTEDGPQYLVMEYIPGDELAKMLEQQGDPFPVATVLAWADTILGALEYLHGQQPPVIHRDIKPHNLKLTPSGAIVLLDFGIAKGNAGAGHSFGQTSIDAYSLYDNPKDKQ